MSLSDRVPVGMMTLVFDFDPADLDWSSKRLRRELGPESASYLMSFEAGLQQEYNGLGKPPEFSIDIRYRIALTQKPGDGDIVLSKGPKGGEVVKIVEVAKESDKTHPYRQVDARNLLQQRLSLSVRPSAYEIEAVRRVYRVDRNSAWFYRSGVSPRTPQFSDTFVDWLVQQIQRDPLFLDKAKAKDQPASAKATTGSPAISA
jgi:hypothetical protein